MADPVVLVVDDELNVVRLCQRLLERADFRVLSATTASQALAIFAREPVDLLLADIRMPGLDGFQLLDMARRHQPDLAAVIMTGFGTIETAISALHHGADSLILKPFQGSDLVQTVQRALAESQHKRDSARLRALRPLFEIAGKLFAETDAARLNDLIAELVFSHLSCSFSAVVLRKTASSPPSILSQRGYMQGGAEDNCCTKLLEICSPSEPVWAYLGGPGSAQLQEFLTDRKLSSILCAPLVYSKRSKLMVAARSEGSPVFRESDFEMFAILARQASLALENAHLYTKLRATIQQVEKSQHVLVQAEKMAAAGRLTASIAHEINNPLQSLNNCLHLAGRKELSSAERNRYLEMAQSELDRLMTTVQRMLEIYRPGVRDRTMTNINQVVERVLMLLEPQLRKGTVKVHTSLHADLPLVVVVASQIQQVLINLLLNSLEAMPGGGDIFVETRPSTAEQVQGTVSGIDITVEDTGPGVSESYSELIFEPFMSTKETGTGLGLSVSYGIISAHGGSLELIKGRGKGATFRIFLPKDHV